MAIARTLTKSVLIILLVAMVVCGAVLLLAVGGRALSGAPLHWETPGFSPFFHPLRALSPGFQTSAIHLAVFLLMMLLIVFVVSGLVAGLLSAPRRRAAARPNESEHEAEAREIRDLCRGLERMNERVEALETILLNRTGRR